MPKNWFTLVEIIVTITIIIILGTVAMLSYSNYSSTARDGTRITHLREIEKALWLYMSQYSRLPEPDSSVWLRSWGTTLRTQWYLWETSSSKIGLFDGIKDPLTETFVTYVVNSTYTRYELVTYMENIAFQFPIINQTYAASTFIKTIGKPLWVGFIWTTLIQDDSSVKTAGFIDLQSTTTLVTLQFKDNVSFTGTGQALVTALWVLDSTIGLSDSSLVLNYDFWFSKTLTTLKDFSWRNNKWTCYTGSSINKCVTNWTTMTMAGGESVAATNNVSLDSFPLGFTIEALIKPPSTWPANNYYRIGILGKSRSTYLLSIYGAYRNITLFFRWWVYQVDSVLLDNQWNDIVATYNGTSVIIYLNGVAVSTQAATGTVPSLSSSVLLGVGDIDGNFTGTIKRAMIFNRALSSAEIVLLNDTK